MTFQWKVIFVICLFFSAKPLRYSRSICPVFVGATLRGRPSMGKISFQCRPRWHATNFVHFAALLLMTGSSFIPQKHSFCGSPTDARFEMWITPGGVEPRPYEIRGTR